MSVGGVTVTNATLHNLFEIRKKGVRVGDTVVVRRAGDVIPEVVRRVPGERTAYVPNFRMPATCPICGSEVVREKGEANHRCTGGLFCAAQRKEALLHFAARRAMDIEGLGDKLVDQLVDGNVVRSLPDLYRLRLDDLASLDRMAEKSAQNVLDALEKSKSTTLNRFLFGLGIRHVGGHSQGSGAPLWHAGCHHGGQRGAAAGSARCRPRSGREHSYLFRTAS